MSKRCAAFIVAVLALAAPRGAHAQDRTRALQLIEQARTRIEGLTQMDSARALLEGALRSDTTRAVRMRAFTLMAFVQLELKNRIAARQAFEQALRLDLAMRIDSLADFHSDAPLVFAEARTIATAAAAAAPEKVVLLLTVLLPADTLVSTTDARLPMIVQPNAVSRTITTIAAVGAPGAPVWSDTQTTVGRHRLAWPLRRPDGAMWASGLYRFRAQSTDSAGQMTTEERLIRLARAPVDTQAHPAELPSSAFAPEALPPAPHTTPRLLAGSGIALLAMLAPSMLGSPELNSGLSGDPTSYAVAGGVAVASVVGFLKGRRSQPLKENIQKNKALRERDERQREAIAAANADALQKAPIRITVEKTP